MTGRRAEGKKNPYLTLRYFLFSLIATGLLAVGVLGFMSGNGEFGRLLGDYREVVHANWQYLIMFGLFVGVSNFLLAFSNR